MTKSTTWDVIVVGAGPAGCTAATLLARQGLRVALLDRSAAPLPKVCGEYLSPGCLHILDELGALSLLRGAGARPLYGMVIHTAEGRRLEAPYPGAENARTRSVHGLSIGRATLDPILLDVAVGHGANFRSNFQVSDLVWEDGRVGGVRGRHRGRMTTLRARLIVGADGRNSVVARRMGSVTRHRWLDKVAMVGHVTGARRADDVGEIFLGRDRYGILNPVAPDLTNIGLVLNRRELDSRIEPTRLLLESAATLRGLGERLDRARLIGPIRCLGPLARRATRLAAPGALLIGDAAGFLDPFTGEGIYAGLRSAELAAHIVLPLFHAGSVGWVDTSAYGLAWPKEFDPKWRLCSALQYAIHRPSLAEWLVTILRNRPSLTGLLMAAVGDLLPPHDLSALRLLGHCLSRPAAAAEPPLSELQPCPTSRGERRRALLFQRKADPTSLRCLRSPDDCSPRCSGRP